jgi:chlorophyll(ide) b reductase
MPRCICRDPLKLSVMIRGRHRGGVAGVGRALASAFLEAGDNVCVCSRSDTRVSEAVKGLQADIKRKGGGGTVKGIAANVAKPADVAQLGRFAVQQFGGIDLWINNAGSNAYRCFVCSAATSLLDARLTFCSFDPLRIDTWHCSVCSYVPLAENNVQDLISIVETNTLGTMLCCREVRLRHLSACRKAGLQVTRCVAADCPALQAIRIMRDQPTGGHVFLMDGAHP